MTAKVSGAEQHRTAETAGLPLGLPAGGESEE